MLLDWCVDGYWTELHLCFGFCFQLLFFMFSFCIIARRSGRFRNGGGGGDGGGGVEYDDSICQVNKEEYTKTPAVQVFSFILQLWSMLYAFFGVSLWMRKAF